MTSAGRVLFSGYFGAGNIGDEAILGVELDQFRGALGGAFEPIVVAVDEATARHFHLGIATVAADDLDALASAVRSAEIVIWGGGGLLQDWWEMPVQDLFRGAAGGLLWHLRVPMLAIAHGIPCVAYAQGVGPLKQEESRRLVALVLNRLDAITVRDAASARLLKDCGVEAPIVLSADPCVSIPDPDPEAGERILTVLGLRSERRPVIAFLPRCRPGGTDQDLEDAIGSVAEWMRRCRGSAAVIAMDHGPAGDDDLCRKIAARLGTYGVAAALTDWVTADEVASLLKACDVVLTVRLHGIYLAAAAGTGVVGLEYDPKVRSAAAEFGSAIPVFPLSGFSREDMIRSLNAAADRGIGGRLLASLKVLRIRESENLRTARAVLEEYRQDSAIRAAEPRAASVERARAAVLTAEVTDLAERLALERSESHALTVRAAGLEAELNALRQSAAFRLVFRYWDLLGRFLPEGGFPRRAYRAFRRRLPKRSRRLTTAGRPASPSEDRLAGLRTFVEETAETPEMPLVSIFSPTKYRESEGQRTTQWAREFLRRGWRVVFCYWRWEETDWEDALPAIPGLFAIPIDLVASRPAALFGSPRSGERLVFFQFPHPSFFESLAMAAGRGWVTVYDVMDDWEEFHRVGQGVWFDASFERHLAGAADLVTAVNDPLAVKISGASNRSVLTVPNGVLPGIDRIDRKRRLTKGTITVGYFGYLASAWFDWELIRAAARARPAWRFHIVGYGEIPRRLPKNVRFLGRKPQSQLASFAANWDVGVVPFKSERLAALADPIKTYEYLAMGLPVVVTGVPVPEGANHLVRRASNLDEFLDQIQSAAAEPESHRDDRRRYADGCSWERRLESILGAIGRGDQRVAAKRALFGADA